MAVVFLEGGLSPIPMQMASTKLNRGPCRWVCQLAYCRTRRLIDPKCNWLLKLGFFASSTLSD
jgi:hypothetical protein